MNYFTQSGSNQDPKGKGKQVVKEEDQEDNDDLVRYDLKDDRGDSGLVKNKQAGVIHLVHEWIQQGQSQKVGLQFLPRIFLRI